MDKRTAELFLGKEVIIYPDDTDSRYGVVESVDDSGVTFRITRSWSRDYEVGKLHFIAYSARLSMREV